MALFPKENVFQQAYELSDDLVVHVLLHRQKNTTQYVKIEEIFSVDFGVGNYTLKYFEDKLHKA